MTSRRRPGAGRDPISSPNLDPGLRRDDRGSATQLPTALIGSTGFVGQTLQRSITFDALYHRPNIDSIRGQRFGTLICAGLPAEKWRANREPAPDLANMERNPGLWVVALIMLPSIYTSYRDIFREEPAAVLAPL